MAALSSTFAELIFWSPLLMVLPSPVAVACINYSVSGPAGFDSEPKFREPFVCLSYFICVMYALCLLCYPALPVVLVLL